MGRPQISSTPTLSGQDSLNRLLGTFEEKAFPQRHNNQNVRPSAFSFDGLFVKFVTREFLKAGITIDGPKDSDIQILNPRAYSMIALYGSLGFGEAYMLGFWTSARIDKTVELLFRSNASRRRCTPPILFRMIKAMIFNLQSLSRSKVVCNVHYDLDNHLFKKMLDRRMVYTCAYWKDSQTLEEAQVAKLELICKKLDLKPGMRVLDIGCGFGSFMKFAAQTYGVECVGYSLSKEQSAYGEKDCLNLPIKFVFNDYRRIEGQFDRIVSIGMIEAVGYKNYSTFMNVIHSALKEDGVALIHTVGHNLTTKMTDPWVDKYIFPNGILPSISQIGKAIEGLFVMEDWHNFGPDYNKTLLAWNERFQNAWPDFQERYDEKFKRMWEFYLLSFAAGFAARNWQVWQIVLTKKGRSQPDCRLS